MKPIKITCAPTGFEGYSVYDKEGVCRVGRGMWAAQHLIEDTSELSATKTKFYTVEWDGSI